MCYNKSGICCQNKKYVAYLYCYIVINLMLNQQLSDEHLQSKLAIQACSPYPQIYPPSAYLKHLDLAVLNTHTKLIKRPGRPRHHGRLNLRQLLAPQRLRLHPIDSPQINKPLLRPRQNELVPRGEHRVLVLGLCAAHAAGEHARESWRALDI